MPLVVDKYALFEKVGYVPHPKQRLFHDSRARFKIPVCGRRFGKSTMAGRDVEAELFVPDGWYWIVGPTYDLGEKEFRVVWNDLIIKAQLGRNKGVKKGYNKRSGEMYIEFPWQTRIEVRSAQHPENLVGEGLNGAIMSEAAKHSEETWQRFIRPALADKRGWASFPTTPEGHNWLYKLWLLGKRDDMAAYASWKFPSWDNPAVYPGGRQDEEILLLELTTDPIWFQQEIGADFASFVGKIYAEFDEAQHVKAVQYDPMLPNYVAFDFGYVNPLAAIEFQVTKQDEIRIWREHYKSYTRLDDHIAILKNREQPPGYKIDLCFGDPADPEAVETISTKFAPCMAMPECKTNWREGIDTVKSFLKERPTGEVIDEYGTPPEHESPGLFVDPKCTNTIAEFTNYRTMDNLKSNTKESSTNSAARKVDDHAMDAIRYALVHLFKLGAANAHLDAGFVKSDQTSVWTGTSSGEVEHLDSELVSGDSVYESAFVGQVY